MLTFESTGHALMPMLSIARVALSAHAAAMSGAAIEHYVGTARDMAGRELYTESHWISETSGIRQLLVLFLCPDGKPFARKQVIETEGRRAPSFVLDDARTGYREGVRDRADGSREVFVRSGGDELERTAPLTSTTGLVVDAGFDSFVRDHWESLATGTRQHLDFLVPGRLRTYPFTLGLVDEELLEGKPVRRFLLELDTWYGFAIPSIVVTYTTDSRTVREYRGIANVRDHKGKNLDVRIEFPPSDRTTTVDARALADAMTTRLDGECVL